MAQAGYTPISLYYSTTASATPSAGNLVAGELALNTLDEKLYFKNSAGTVKLLASSASTTNVQTISFGSTGLTPSTATSGAVTVAGTLAVGNGGTGITSFGTGVAGALGQNVSGSGSIALTTSPVFTTPNLGTPSAVTLTNASGLPLSTGVTGTLPITSGGTGQTTASAAFDALNPMTTVGDMIYEGTGPTATRLAIGTTGQILTVSGGIPAWSTPAAGGVTTISFGSTGLTPSTATSGAVSVAGTLAIANGGTGSTSTTYCNLASNVTGTLPVANGGTGQTTYTDGQILIGNTTGNTLTKTTLTGTSNQIVVTNGSGSITLSTPQSIGTASSVQFGSFGVGTAASGTSGEIRATNNVTAFYSDARLKDFKGTIPNALDKVLALNGYYFTENETAKKLGYNNDGLQVGVSAQEVEAVLPEVVTDAPINANFEGADYKTVYYDKLVPLLIEAIKELSEKVKILEAK